MLYFQASSLRELTLPSSFTIKGQPTEDAVLCTSDKTYSLRSVVLSNSILVVTPPIGASTDVDDSEITEDVVIRDQISEVLELVPSVPKLHKLGLLLKGMEYEEGREDEDMNVDGGRVSSSSEYIFSNWIELS
jgi:sister chromatid cohesion protein DCC1